MESVAGVGHVRIGQPAARLYRVGSILHAPTDPRAGRLHRVGSGRHARVVSGRRRSYQVGAPGTSEGAPQSPASPRPMGSVATLLIVREGGCCSSFGLGWIGSPRPVVSVLNPLLLLSDLLVPALPFCLFSSAFLLALGVLRMLVLPFRGSPRCRISIPPRVAGTAAQRRTDRRDDRHHRPGGISASGPHRSGPGRTARLLGGRVRRLLVMMAGTLEAVPIRDRPH